MIGKVFFVLCGLALLSPVYPVNGVEQSETITRRDALVAQLKSTNLADEALRMVLPNPQETILNLAELFKSNRDPDVSSILDVFNYNFGTRLLVVRGENIQVDASAFQKFLSSQARVLAKSLYPKNFFQQLTAYGFLQKEILRASEAVRPDIESRTVPVQRITALVDSDAHRIFKRDVVSDLVNSVGTTICNSLVTLAYTQLNTTLNTADAFLDGLAIAGDSILALIASIVVDFGKTAIKEVRTLANALTESICTILLSLVSNDSAAASSNSTAASSNSTATSRKRREVADITGLATRDVAFDNVFGGLVDVVLQFIFKAFNTILKYIVEDYIGQITTFVSNFLDTNLTTLLEGLIDTVFPVSS